MLDIFAWNLFSLNQLIISAFLNVWIKWKLSPISDLFAATLPHQDFFTIDKETWVSFIIHPTPQCIKLKQHSYPCLLSLILGQGVVCKHCSHCQSYIQVKRCSAIIIPAAVQTDSSRKADEGSTELLTFHSPVSLVILRLFFFTDKPSQLQLKNIWKGDVRLDLYEPAVQHWNTSPYQSASYITADFELFWHFRKHHFHKVWSMYI